MSEPKIFWNQNMVSEAKWLTYIHIKFWDYQQSMEQIQKLLEFYSKLVTHAPALKKMGKLNVINKYVRTVLDRLPGIGSDIVRNDNWQECEFTQFFTTLEKWTLKETWYLAMNLRKELEIIGKKSWATSKEVCLLWRWQTIIPPVHCVKYRNFTQFPGVEILWKGTVSR